MSEQAEHGDSCSCPECDAKIEEIKAYMTYIADLEALIRREVGEAAVPERPVHLKTESVANYLSDIERSREKMKRDQAEIDQLKAETRAMISKLLAA